MAVCHTAVLTLLFIHIIHCYPHFVQLVIIMAIRIDLYMLKCMQIRFFKNFFNSFLQKIPAQNIAPAALFSQERHGTHFTVGWVVHRAVMDGGISRPHLDSIPDR